MGIALLLNLGWGVGLLGVGVVMFASQLERMYFALKVEGFGLVLGVCFAVAGLSRLLDLQWDQAPISAWLVPSLLIVAGATALVTAWRHRPGA